MKTHTGIVTVLLLGLAALAQSGCANQPAAVSSGKPKVVIASRDVDGMKSSLIGEMASLGYHVEKEMPDMLEVSRATTDPITAHAVGTVEGTHQRVVTYTFTRQGVSTGVVADVSERAPLSGGQVETISLNDNGAVYGFFQKQLNRLKETVE